MSACQVSCWSISPHISTPRKVDDSNSTTPAFIEWLHAEAIWMFYSGQYAGILLQREMLVRIAQGCLLYTCPWDNGLKFHSPHKEPWKVVLHKPHGRTCISKMCLEVQGGHTWQSSNDTKNSNSCVTIEGKQEKTGQRPHCCLLNSHSESQGNRDSVSCFLICKV